MFKLTFNRPAVRQFIEGNDNYGLRIRTTDDGKVQFLPSTSAEEDTANLSPRTRGGYESIVEGTGADEILKLLKNPHGPFFVLKRVSDGWVQAEPYTGRDAPPKFEPHVRVWHANQPKSGKAAPARIKASKPKATATTTAAPIDIAERVRWAYEKLGGEKRPGRPSREVNEAREIKRSFEQAVSEFMTGLPLQNDVDVKAIVGVYHQLGEFLKHVAPEALEASTFTVRRTSRPKQEIGQKDPNMAKAVAEKFGFVDKTPMVPGGKKELDTHYAHA
jgi:hypothetical protein